MTYRELFKIVDRKQTLAGVIATVLREALLLLAARPITMALRAAVPTNENA
jgi:hypothetical protein